MVRRVAKVSASPTDVQVPMVIRGPGGVGRQLGAEHSQRLESYFQSIPGVQLVRLPPNPPTHTSVSPAPGAHGICIVCDVGLRLCHPRQPTLPTRIAYSDSIPAARIASTVQYAPLTAGRVLNSSQCQGALEECHPQRQPHHLLRARASLQRQGCTLLPALSSSQPAGSIEQYAPVMRMAGAAYPLQHLQCQLGANRMLFWVGTDAAVADWQAAGSGRAGWR